MPIYARPLASYNIADWKQVLKGLGILFYIILSFYIWYITVPALAIWYLWKKTKFSRKTNIIVTAVLVVVFAILGGAAAYANRAPTLTINDPQNNYSIKAQSISVKGRVNPAKASVVINGNNIATDSSGNFSYQAKLPSEGNNQISIIAGNGGKQVSNTLTITRIFTDEEKAAQAKARADAEAQQQAQAAADAKAAQEAAAQKAATDAQAKAEQTAYEKTPAGKLCTKYPNWTKDDCETIAAHKVNIGMSEEQAIAAWGNPEKINTTSSAYGKHEQWVYGMTSYLYFDEGILTTVQN